MDKLVKALVAFRMCRGASAEWVQVNTRFIVGCCQALLLAPAELGTHAPTSDQGEYASCCIFLERAEQEELPEATACRLWFANAGAGKTENAAQEFLSLARKPLWEPVRALVYRGLAHFGERQVLGHLNREPQEMPSLVQADALLGAALAGSWEDVSLPDLSVAPAQHLSEGLQLRWRQVLKAEWMLTQGADCRLLDSVLSSLAVLPALETAPTIDAIESGRVAARAAAALIRCRLAQRRDISQALRLPAVTLLPAWEQLYLQALAQWAVAEHDNAAVTLQEAAKLNPHQTCVRLALSSLLVPTDRETALAVLDVKQPTRELIILKAMLLTRMGRHSEAEDLLILCSGPAVPNESARFSWPLVRSQFRWRENALRTALAERRRDWKAAEKAWSTACSQRPRKALKQSRQLLQSKQELIASPKKESYRCGTLRRRIRRIERNIASGPMTGPETFFRGIALMVNDRDRAHRDLSALLRRNTWVTAQCRVGGGRLVAVGDALARLGDYPAAVHAYDLARRAGCEGIAQRAAIMAILQAVLSRAAEPDLASAVEKATQTASESWPLQLIAAASWIVRTKTAKAKDHIAAAVERGAPNPYCRFLRRLCDALEGNPPAAPEAAAQWSWLSATSRSLAMLLLNAGEAHETASAFTSALGEKWMAECPVDPAVVACRQLAGLCDRHMWPEALSFVESLLSSQADWVAEIAVLVHVRYALAQAIRGKLDDAESHLCHFEAAVLARQNQATKSLANLSPAE